jgi:hypothetical protein
VRAAFELGIGLALTGGASTGLLVWRVQQANPIFSNDFTLAGLIVSAASASAFRIRLALAAATPAGIL